MANRPEIIYDNYKEIGTVEMYLGRRAEVSIAAKDGMKWLRVRMYRQDAKTLEWRPTREGVTFPLVYVKPFEDVQCGQQIVDMIVKALAMTEDFALYDADNMVVREK